MKEYWSRLKSKERCPPRKPLKKIVWSWLGAFLGILCIAFLDRYWGAGEGQNLLLIGSFGASSVLIYGAPQADFSQPRNFLGGQVLSATVGVAVYSLLGEQVELACALAVSVSILVMHLTRTMHPPGGATALIAVTGGNAIGSLGFSYVFFPVLTGSVVLLGIALVVNNLSRNPKRHYPTYWI